MRHHGFRRNDSVIYVGFLDKQFTVKQFADLGGQYHGMIKHYLHRHKFTGECKGKSTKQIILPATAGSQPQLLHSMTHSKPHSAFCFAQQPVFDKKINSISKLS